MRRGPQCEFTCGEWRCERRARDGSRLCFQHDPRAPHCSFQHCMQAPLKNGRGLCFQHDQITRDEAQESSWRRLAERQMTELQQRIADANAAAVRRVTPGILRTLAEEAELFSVAVDEFLFSFNARRRLADGQGLTPKQAAEECGVTAARVLQIARKPDVHFVKFPNGTILIDAESLRRNRQARVPIPKNRT